MPFAGFFTSTDGCIETDDIRLHVICRFHVLKGMEGPSKFPSFHPERNVLCVINQKEDEIWNLISAKSHQFMKTRPPVLADCSEVTLGAKPVSGIYHIRASKCTLIKNPSLKE